MSDLSLKVAKALFAKSNVPALVGAGKLTALYESRPPKSAVLPYGVFGRQAPGPVVRNFGPTLAAEDDLWLLKVLAGQMPATAKSPQLFAEEMLVVWESTIAGELTLTGGGSVTWCERFADMPPFEEEHGDKWIVHRGFLLRVVTE